MQDQAGTFDLSVTRTPFASPDAQRCHEGRTIAQIMADLDFPKERLLHIQVTISHGTNSAVVPFSQWHLVRPRAGSVVEAHPLVHGPAVGLVLSAVVASAAPVVAGALFPALSGFALSLATTAITVVGQLAVNALIPPPNGGGGGADDPTFTITGSSNAITPYGVFPTVIGRHMMFPPQTARGYTETVDGEIYFRGRYTFGYGPVSLETLRIGTTPITEFEDVEIEFLNVDQSRTEANIPALVGAATWRNGAEAMRLYPDAIIEDPQSVLLMSGVPTTRNTRLSTVAAQVDIGFSGLINLTAKGNRFEEVVEYSVEYAPVGSSTFVNSGTLRCAATTTSYVRFTHEIQFPSEGQWQVRVTRITPDETDEKDRADGFFSSLRSVKSGGLPSNPNISEVALRIRATEQINGQVDNLNGIVQQLAPVWDGTSWSAPQPVRHPAWQYAKALMGPALRKPTTGARIGLSDLKAWFDEEPHWTCDTVIDQPVPVSEVLDIICAAGRAKRAMNDLKHSIIRDGGAGPVVQHFSPRNSFGFRGARVLTRVAHAFRVRFTSEALDWQQDEVIVYADGYNAANATEIDTLDLRAVVVTTGEGKLNNPWRLGRYHIAQAKLRPEEFFLKSDLDHVKCQMGSKIRVVHDVALFGVGDGRVRSVQVSGNTIAAIDLDDEQGFEIGSRYRLRVRRDTGAERTIIADYTAARSFAPTSTEPTSSAVKVGDLVLVELTTQQSVDLLIRSIQHEGDMIAGLRCVPAAPEVLTADGGTIPDYNPLITPPVRYGPTPPIIDRVVTGVEAALISPDGQSLPRIGAIFRPVLGGRVTPVEMQARWRPQIGGAWTYGPKVPVAPQAFTQPLTDGTSYQTAFRYLDANSRPSDWTSAPNVTALSSVTALAAPAGWIGVARPTSVVLSGSDEFVFDFRRFEIYAYTSANSSSTLIGYSAAPQFEYTPPPGSNFTRYRIRMQTHSGLLSSLTPYINVSPLGISTAQLSTVVTDIIIGVQNSAQEGIDAALGLGDFLTDNASLTVDLNGDGNGVGIRVVEYATDGETLETSSSAVLFDVDQIAVPGTISTNKLLVGLGSNLLDNSDFTNAKTQFVQRNENGTIGAQTTLTARAKGLSFAGKNYSTMMLFQDGTHGTGWVEATSVRYNADGTFDSEHISVNPGGWYEFSVAASTHRCDGQVVIVWLDINDAPVSNSRSDMDYNVKSSTNNPDAWPRYWTGPRQAPAGAVFARVGVRKNPTQVDSDSYVFFHKPMFAESHENAKAPTRYSPKGSTLVDGDMLMTGEIFARHLDVVNAVISNSAQIGTANIQTVNIAGEQITATRALEQGFSPRLYDASTNWHTVKQWTVTLPHVAIYILQGFLDYSGATGSNAKIGIRLKINGNVISTKVRTGQSAITLDEISQNLIILAGTSTISIEFLSENLGVFEGNRGISVARLYIFGAVR